ncbi:MAG: hypothetical protein AAB612_01415 [Patescibacteria group bacterium]
MNDRTEVILTLSAENKRDILQTLLIKPLNKISPRAKKLRERFRGIKLDDCIYTDLIARTLFHYFIGNIQKTHDDIQRIAIGYKRLFPEEDFSTSVTAMIQIIREELQVE